MGRLRHTELAGIKVFGFSLAGEETVVAAPEYNVCFDAGRAPREIIPIDNLCVSHGHMDHTAGIAYYLSQRNFIGTAPGRVIVHRSLAQAVQRLMDVWSEIEGHHTPFEVVGVVAMEDVSLRRDLIVRPFDVNHGAGAIGYTLIEVRHKLKEEFIGKTGPQLVALKRSGVEIQRRAEAPILTYTGDTAIGRFLDLDFVRRCPALIVECTFFDREHLHRARAGRHMHVEDLPKVLEAVPDAEVLLTHHTRRTDLRFARRMVDRILSSRDRDRVAFLMEAPPQSRAAPSVPTPDDSVIEGLSRP